LKGPQLLRDVLQRSALEEDWLLAGMACQALWNFLIDSSNVIDSLGEDEADLVAGDLAEYLGIRACEILCSIYCYFCFL
jgi:hypothetical protein